MALFQKKPVAGTSVPLYSVSLEQTVLVVGLGNIGKEYSGTRHNIGFAVLDSFAQDNDLPDWLTKKDLHCHLSSKIIGSKRVIAIKPTTYMNNSGQAVRAVMDFYKVTPQNVIVVHDELDIPFGQIRTRMGGSSAGQNGVESVIAHIGEKFGRVRVGIANEFSKMADASEFVLGKFTQDEQVNIPVLKREASVLIAEYIALGELPHETRSVF
jgi:PTH1 family peptidyl-tRNA hydrolase